MRAARKRRSKLHSRRVVSSLSSGAMAGRGGAAVLLGRQGGSGAVPRGGGPEAVRGAGAGLGAGQKRCIGTGGGAWGWTAFCSGPGRRGLEYRGGARWFSVPGCGVGNGVGRRSGVLGGGCWSKALGRSLGSGRWGQGRRGRGQGIGGAESGFGASLKLRRAASARSGERPVSLRAR